MAWLGLAAAVAWNYHEYRHDRVTICGVTRRTVPRPAFLPVYATGAVILAFHVWRGYNDTVRGG